MIFIYLFVLGLAIVLFVIFGGRNRRRRRQNAAPQVDVTTKPNIGRAPGED